MAKYCYYPEGSKIQLLELNSEGIWESPGTTVSSGMIIEYQQSLPSPSAESSTLQDNDGTELSRTICMAIIDYVKFRKVQDVDSKLAEYYRTEFYKKVSREKNRTSGAGGRAPIPRGTAVLR